MHSIERKISISHVERAIGNTPDGIKTVLITPAKKKVHRSTFNKKF